MRRRIITLTAYAILAASLLSGWHILPLAIWVGLWLAGFRGLEYHETELHISDDELYKWIDG